MDSPTWRRDIPHLLDDLAARPQVLSHGDACSQNLLIQNDGFVAIDWSPGGMVAAGDDLGQLLITACSGSGRN